MARRSRLPSFADFRRFSGLWLTDWRWARACRVVESGRRFGPRSDDAPTRLAVRHLTWRADGSPQGGGRAKRFADIAAAHEIYEKAGEMRLAIEARLLARQSFDEIAALTGVPTSVVVLFESLFFNVLDRLDAIDWIACVAIGRGRGVGCVPEPYAVLKSYAYCGGPLILDSVWPYLVGETSLAVSDGPPPQSLTDLLIRRSVIVSLLPDGPNPLLLKIYDDLLAQERLAAQNQQGTPLIDRMEQTLLSTIHEARGAVTHKSQGVAESAVALSTTGPVDVHTTATAVSVGRGGETSDAIAQTEGDHGLGETVRPDVLLPRRDGRRHCSEGLPGPRPGGLAGSAERPDPAARTEEREGVRAERTRTRRSPRRAVEPVAHSVPAAHGGVVTGVGDLGTETGNLEGVA
jgi:hypothetical protein